MNSITSAGRAPGRGAQSVAIPMAATFSYSSHGHGGGSSPNGRFHAAATGGTPANLAATRSCSVKKEYNKRPLYDNYPPIKGYEPRNSDSHKGNWSCPVRDCNLHVNGCKTKDKLMRHWERYHQADREADNLRDNGDKTYTQTGATVADTSKKGAAARAAYSHNLAAPAPRTQNAAPVASQGSILAPAAALVPRTQGAASSIPHGYVLPASESSIPPHYPASSARRPAHCNGSGALRAYPSSIRPLDSGGYGDDGAVRGRKTKRRDDDDDPPSGSSDASDNGGRGRTGRVDKPDAAGNKTKEELEYEAEVATMTAEIIYNVAILKEHGLVYLMFGEALIVIIPSACRMLTGELLEALCDYQNQRWYWKLQKKHRVDFPDMPEGADLKYFGPPISAFCNETMEFKSFFDGSQVGYLGFAPQLNVFEIKDVNPLSTMRSLYRHVTGALLFPDELALNGALVPSNAGTPWGFDVVIDREKAHWAAKWFVEVAGSGLGELDELDMELVLANGKGEWLDSAVDG